MIRYTTGNLLEAKVDAPVEGRLVEVYVKPGDQVAAGQVDGAYLLTTKNYRSHVNRQQFIRFLAGLQLNRYRNLKSGRPRLEEGQLILTVKLKSDGSDELPLDFTFVKVEDQWRVDRITKLAAA